MKISATSEAVAITIKSAALVHCDIDSNSVRPSVRLCVRYNDDIHSFIYFI